MYNRHAPFRCILFFIVFIKGERHERKFEDPEDVEFINKNQKLPSTVGQIDLKAGEKVLAQGLPNAFEEPVKLAPYKQQINDGVYDGLPTQCFVKIIFEPGTYDDSINISELDYLGSAYSLDYSPLD